MKVREACTPNVKACNPWTNLAAVGWIMWENDCGIVPVVDQDQQVVGVITDRDICIALATKTRPAADVMVSEVITGGPVTCRLEDEIDQALDSMRIHQVRRLPVVDAEGKLVGILSLNDLILQAQEKGDLSFSAVVRTLQAVGAHRIPRDVEEPKLLGAKL